MSPPMSGRRSGRRCHEAQVRKPAPVAGERPLSLGGRAAGDAAPVRQVHGPDQPGDVPGQPVDPAEDLAPPVAAAVAGVGELAVGDVKIFSYPTANDPCLLVRVGPSDWVAYSQKCTHLSCAVV